MKKLLFTLMALSMGLYASDSSAQIFTIKVTDYGGIADPTLRNFVDEQILKVQNEINKDLPSAPPERLMEGMANASVMAGKGLASDYASGMKVFLIGANVGAGADLAKDKNTDSDVSGVGVAPGVVVGMNLGFMDAEKFLGMDTNRLNLYLNFMSYKHEQQINEDPGKESSADLDMTALGFRMRYDWIEGNGSKLLGWGGVKFHFGYEYNKTNIAFNSKINESVNETSSTGEVLTGTITGAPQANIAVATHSIPLELSTDVQLLYILSLYVGVGADYSWGQAKGNGTLNAPTSPITCNGGAACGGGQTIQVQPDANIDATGKASGFLYRGFAGVQINLPYFRIYGQVNKPIGNDLIGANVGVRFVY
ncbi:Lsa36 family surface (lipo)protein [Peredibacter sp. HCB2-198]|uniref:Lsa36 family surface (lipo)protein n=1 Tax=Peredibacter sp. HCB2-198 TaxID=3383025 RepID=UPI0038B47EAB